jgi:hypothetical protein
MMITNPGIHCLLGPPKWVEYAVMAFFIVFVCGLSKWLTNQCKAAISIAQFAAGDDTV